MFTFPCATNQARALTFEGAFELHKNSAGRNKIGFETFDKAKKKDFTENKLDDGKNQALESTKEGEKNTELREDINLKEINFCISKIATKIRIPRQWKGIAKDI